MTTSITISAPRPRGGALVALMLGLILPASALAANFVVITLDGEGEGSLQQAILDANVNGAADTITFAPDLAGRTILLFPIGAFWFPIENDPAPTSPSTARRSAASPTDGPKKDPDTTWRSGHGTSVALWGEVWDIDMLHEAAP
jgi:hypothetical protein